MQPRLLIRIEGLIVFVLATAAFFSVGKEYLLYVILVIAPDLSMIGYMINERVGSRIYNIFHTYSIPLLLAFIGVWAGRTLFMYVGLAWVGHIGIDRALQYGLKYETRFQDTHMQKV